jgi:hypothetical protein
MACSRTADVGDYAYGVFHGLLTSATTSVLSDDAVNFTALHDRLTALRSRDGSSAGPCCPRGYRRYPAK